MDVCAYYDRAVNGLGASTLSVLSGIAPKTPPSIVPSSGARGDPVTVIMESCAPKIALPPLDGDKLKPVSHIIVHGSQATRDACDFSDVDIMVVLEDRRAFTAREHEHAAVELRRLLRAVYRYDSLMHHGLQFCGASRLQAWDQSILPVETLRLGYPLHGPRQLQLYALKADLPALRARVARAVRVLRARLDERDFERGDYAYKQFLSNVLLLPALVAAGRGAFVYKRDAFSLVKEWFAASEWAGMERAERLRRQWKRPAEPQLQRLIGEFAHPCLRVRLSATRQHADNLTLLSPADRRQWVDELQRTLVRAEELAA
jgi:hypothetical protein